MGRRYFGTDGIRGTVGEAPITPDFVLRLGYAAGKVLASSADVAAGSRPTVLIGRTRACRATCSKPRSRPGSRRPAST